VVFGDPTEFAVEVDAEPGSEPRSGAVWGHMCFWVQGEALGNIAERRCLLNHAHDALVWLADHLDTQWAETLAGLDDQAVWNILDGQIYGFHGDVELDDARSAADCERDAFVWRRFEFLTNWGEQFDGYKAFLLCPPGASASILYRNESDPPKRLEVSPGALVSAARELDQWFREQQGHVAGRPTTGWS
jgi:hypothetical protein